MLKYITLSWLCHEYLKCITVKLSWARWRLKSPASRWFAQPFVLAQLKRKRQGSASLACVRGIHQSPVNSRHKGPVTRKMFPLDDVIMWTAYNSLRIWTDTKNNRDQCYPVPQVPSFPRGRHQMETFSALLAVCAGNSPVTGEFPAQRPVTRSLDVCFDLRPNKRLSKQSWGWWFETPSRPLWRHCNATVDMIKS